MHDSRIADPFGSPLALVCQHLSSSACLYFLTVRWSAIILIVCWAADSGPVDQNSGLPISDHWEKKILLYSSSTVKK
jgi:hypothetical protein